MSSLIGGIRSVLTQMSPDYWIAIFTAISAVFIGYQSMLTRKQVKLIREEFIVSHRPRIIMRDVCIDGNDILYILVNTGETNATVIESWILVELVPPNQYIGPLRSYRHDDLGRITFAPGEMKDLSYSIPDAMKGCIEKGALLIGGLYFAGAILYSDANGSKRRSVFRRRWDYQRRGFYGMDDPEQEYAD
jgi:hypothetical protein